MHSVHVKRNYELHCTRRCGYDAIIQRNATCRQTVAKLEMNLIKGFYLAVQSGLHAYIADRVPSENTEYKSTTIQLTTSSYRIDVQKVSPIHAKPTYKNYTK